MSQSQDPQITSMIGLTQRKMWVSVSVKTPMGVALLKLDHFGHWTAEPPVEQLEVLVAEVTIRGLASGPPRSSNFGGPHGDQCWDGCFRK